MFDLLRFTCDKSNKKILRNSITILAGFLGKKLSFCGAVVPRK